jgi:hypothetical protein
VKGGSPMSRKIETSKTNSTLYQALHPTYTPIRVNYIAHTEDGVLHHVTEFGENDHSINSIDVLAKIGNSSKKELNFSIEVQSLVIKKTFWIKFCLKKNNLEYQENNKEIVLPFRVFFILFCKNIKMKILKAI